jgi:hypothetical protein
MAVAPTDVINDKDVAYARSPYLTSLHTHPQAVPSIRDLQFSKLAMTRLSFMFRRLPRPLPNPVAHLALDDKIGRVGVVVQALQALGELPGLVQDLVVVGRPPRHVHLDRVAQVHAECYPVVVDPRVQDDDAVGFAFAEAVNAEGLGGVSSRGSEVVGREEGACLDIDGADLEVVDVGEYRELDGAAPGVHLPHAGGVAVGLVAEDSFAVFVGVVEDVVGHLVAECPRGILQADGAAECSDLESISG